MIRIGWRVLYVDGTMLSVTNTIQDAIHPDITMFVECRNNVMNGKAIVCVTVRRGTARPYYLHSKEIRPEGVCVRQRASTVPATETTILNMSKETGGNSYEAARSLNQQLTFEKATAFFQKRRVEFGRSQMRTLHLIGEDDAYTNPAFLLSDPDTGENRFVDSKADKDMSIVKALFIPTATIDAISILNNEVSKMLKFKMYLISIVSMSLLVGCGNNNIEQTDREIQNSGTFAEYSGYWSYEGKTHEQILAGGGIELSCTITEDNQFSGTLFSQQEMTQRFASIEDISGKIEQEELYFDYTDDEWGNSGTLHIQFLNNSIYVEVLNYKNADNGSDYGISGSFELIRQKEDISENDIADNSSYNSSWTEEEIIKAINERSPYYQASAYYSEIVDYWENVREVRDISNVLEPLFETDKKYYTKKEFESQPMLVIHLAKNEIYARHGYIFTNEDLYNYFMGCIWYRPTCDSTDFDDSIFNEYEKANLEILADLDTY